MTNPAQIDVSPRALAIAREIDRRPAGNYLITLEKVDDKAAQWNVTISGVVTVREFKAFVPREVTETPP